MNCIKTNFIRSDKSLIDKFSQISIPTVSDAMGRHFCMDSSIKPIYKNARLVGPAFTVKTYPSDNLMCHIFISQKTPLFLIQLSS